MTPPRDELQARLTRLEEELATLRDQAKTRRHRVLMLLGAAAFAGTLGSALAANGNCPNGLPFCFAPNTPALASDVNTNFSQLKEWLELKAGPVDAGTFITGSAFFTNNISVNGSGSFSSAVSASTLASTGSTTIGGAETVNGLLTANGGLTVSGPVALPGFQMSCAYGTAGFIFPWCCRINVKTGAASCRIATDWSGQNWGNFGADPFAATTNGHYSISCWQGSNGVNYPTCCRSDTNGNAVCRSSVDWTLSNWGGAGVTF